MGQLHEVLAVESNLKNAAKKIGEEAIHTFSKKPDHFIGVHKTLHMFDDKRSNEEAAQEQRRELVTTVDNKLDYVVGSLVEALDAVAQKEATNQWANADVVVDGNTILSDIPATLLLALEKELVVYRNIYNSIPTLQPGVKWEEAPDLGGGIFQTAKPEIRAKTEKMRLHKELSKATKEHKAQIETWTEDRPVGQYETTHTCGMITPARKSVLLGRIDKLIRAVKQARTRANKKEVTDVHIGKDIFDYINA
jgi:hypothetical protein